MLTRNWPHVAFRIYRELQRDFRTMTLFVASPGLVVLIVWGILANHPETFNRVGLLVVGMFPTAPTLLFVAFAVQRERYRGTLEYLMTNPVSRLDVLVGYIVAFTVPAIAQIAMLMAIAYGICGLDTAGPWWAVALLALLACVLGVSIGVLSAFLARNELQLTKVLVATAVPHIVLSGLFRPHAELVGWMRWLSNIAPWRYMVSAISELQRNATLTRGLWVNAGVVCFVVVLISAASLSTVLTRRSP